MTDMALSSHCPPSPIEMTLSVPQDPKFAPAARDVAVHAAQRAGSGAAAAQAFGRLVEDAFRARVASPASAGPVSVTVRQSTGPLEVVIGDRTLTLEA